VLFDFFGTLVHYSPSVTEQGYPRSHALLCTAGMRLGYASFLALWSDVYEELESAARSTLREFAMTELAGLFLQRAGLPADGALAVALVRTYLEEWNTGVRDLDGLRPMLERLADRFALAIVSNTHDPQIVPDHIERLGIRRCFREIVTSVELGQRKPSPQIYRHALDRFGVAPERCLYVGDTYDADFAGPRAAGMHSLLIDPAASADATDRLRSILDLEAWLAGPHPPRSTTLRP
jgi:putative hydrolase of the HAD superfamily